MRRWMFVGFAMAASWSTLASAQDSAAQDSAAPMLTASQQLGRRLFGQVCGVCHTPPTITSGLYGPALSGDMVKGNEAAIGDFIAQARALRKRIGQQLKLVKEHA